MKVAVTGATGFVGKALLRTLATEHQVMALVRSGTKNLPGNVKSVVIGDLANLSLRLDFIDKEIKQSLINTDVIIHTAARVHIMKEYSVDPLSEFRCVNTEATLALARVAVAIGVKRFIFISTVGVNGGGSTGKPFSEQDTPAPHNDYAKSKWEAEQGLRQIAAKSGMEVVIIRPPLIYGQDAQGSFRTLLKWVRKGVPLPLAKIDNHRSFIALTNLVDFINLVLKHPKAANETFLISDGRDVSTSELLEATADSLGLPSMLFYVPPGLVHLFARLVKREHMFEQLWGSLEIDISKAQAMLGWQPVVMMEQQLRQIAEKESFSIARGDKGGR